MAAVGLRGALPTTVLVAEAREQAADKGIDHLEAHLQ